jgi:hypothetical protein
MLIAFNSTEEHAKKERPQFQQAMSGTQPRNLTASKLQECIVHDHEGGDIVMPVTLPPDSLKLRTNP